MKSVLKKLQKNPLKEVFLDEFEPINDWRLSIWTCKEEFWDHRVVQILNLQESTIDGTWGIFKKGFRSLDDFEIVRWLSSKLEFLKFEQEAMKKFGFQQYRNSGFLFENENIVLDVSRTLGVDSPMGVNQMSRFVVQYGDESFIYLSEGSMLDQLKRFFQDDLPMDDYLLFPPQIRDRLIGELA